MLSFYIGKPLLLVCPTGKGAANIETLGISWTGQGFAVCAGLRCTCCAKPPLVKRVLQPRKNGGPGVEEAWVVA